MHIARLPALVLAAHRRITVSCGTLVLLLMMWLPLTASAQVTLSPGTVPDGTLGGTYSLQLAAQGGTGGPYRFRMIQGPMPPGLTLSTEGLISGTTYQAGLFPFAVEAASSTGQTGYQTYALRVEPSPGLTLSPSSMPQGMAGVRYVQPVAALGGVAPYTLTLVGTLPTGLSFSPASGIDGIPLAAGTFDFRITAVDATSATVSRDYSMVIVPPTLFVYTPTLPEATAGTPYSTTIRLTGGLGPFSYVLSSGSLPSGMSLGATDGVVSGTPAAPGLYPFEVTITDSTIGTPATLTQSFLFVVNDPAVQILPATLPSMYLRVPFSTQLSLNVAGPGPAQFTLLSGELPQGITLSPSGLLSGTPAFVTFGPIECTVQGLYANGVFARRTYRVNVPAAALTVSQLPPATAGVPYAQTLQIVGGIAPYEVAFKVRGGRLGMEMVPGLGLPAGMTITPAVDSRFILSTPGTFTISGTPAASGDFPISMEIVEQSTRRTEYAYLVLKVLPSQPTITPTTLPNASVGLAYRHVLAAQGGVAPYRFALAEGQQLPTGLSLSEDGVISGIPTVQRTSSFDVVVTDATTGTPGRTTATLTLDVTLPTIVIAARSIDMLAGSSATVDLTEGVAGGPFSGAAVVSLSPADAGTASITTSGSGTSARYMLRFVPVKTFSGQATLRYTLSNGAVTSNEATIVFNVMPRPDPSADAEVRGLIDAQAMSARRFADAQMGNFQQRLERLHGDVDGARGFENTIGMSATRDCRTPVGAIPGQRCQAALDASAANATGGRQGDARFGTWAAGVLRSGDRDAVEGRAALDFETEGLSIGADTRLGRFVVGGGMGYGHDRTWVGRDDSRVDARAYTFALYGGRALGERGFVDGLLGYQRLSYDLRRTVTANGATVHGQRDGDQWFASITTGARLGRDRWGVVPYGRAEYTRGTLDGYAETGDALHALRYDAQSLRAFTMDLGVRVDYRLKTAFGMATPYLRIEYQRDLQRSGDATLRYADWLDGPVYRVQPQGLSRDRFELGLGAQFDFAQAWQLGIGYRLLVGNDGDRDQGAQLNLDKRF